MMIGEIGEYISLNVGLLDGALIETEQFFRERVLVMGKAQPVLFAGQVPLDFGRGRKFSIGRFAVNVPCRDFVKISEVTIGEVKVIDGDMDAWIPLRLNDHVDALPGDTVNVRGEYNGNCPYPFKPGSTYHLIARFSGKVERA